MGGDFCLFVPVRIQADAALLMVNVTIMLPGAKRETGEVAFHGVILGVISGFSSQRKFRLQVRSGDIPRGWTRGSLRVAVVGEIETRPSPHRHRRRRGFPRER